MIQAMQVIVFYPIILTLFILPHWRQKVNVVKKEVVVLKLVLQSVKEIRIVHLQAWVFGEQSHLPAHCNLRRHGSCSSNVLLMLVSLITREEGLFIWLFHFRPKLWEVKLWDLELLLLWWGTDSKLHTLVCILIAVRNGRERGQLCEELVVVIIMSHLLFIDHLLDLHLQYLRQRVVLKEVLHECLKPRDLHHHLLHCPLILSESLLPLPDSRLIHYATHLLHRAACTLQPYLALFSILNRTAPLAAAGGPFPCLLNGCVCTLIKDHLWLSWCLVWSMICHSWRRDQSYQKVSYKSSLLSFMLFWVLEAVVCAVDYLKPFSPLLTFPGFTILRPV